MLKNFKNLIKKADTLIVVGVILLIVDFIIDEVKSKKGRKDDSRKKRCKNIF